jgi:hypothetical protein
MVVFLCARLEDNGHNTVSTADVNRALQLILSQYKIYNSACSPFPEPAACIQKPLDGECLRDTIAGILKR